MAGNDYVAVAREKGWNFFDITEVFAPDDKPLWDVLRPHAPARHVLDGGTYALAPQPQRDQTLAEAFDATTGLGPCLRIGVAIPTEYLHLHTRFLSDTALFTRLAMRAGGVELYLPGPRSLGFDRVELPLKTAAQTFERDFDVITRGERERALAIGRTLLSQNGDQ